MHAKSKPLIFQVAITFLALTFFFPLHAADPEFPSVWRATEIVVDGSASDWAGKLVPIPDSPYVVGLQNDGAFMYLCLKTSDDAAKKRIQALGVNFYFDASGKEDRAFGVRYPAPAEPPAKPQAEGPGDSPEEGQLVHVRRQASSGEIQVLGRDAEGGGRMNAAQMKPLAAAMAESDGALVLELKIPLAFSLEAPFAILTQPGKTIAIGLEGAQPSKELRSAGRQGGRRVEGNFTDGRGAEVGVNTSGGFQARVGGVGVGVSGSGSGGRGGQRHQEGAKAPEHSPGTPIKQWFLVPLATPPA